MTREEINRDIIEMLEQLGIIPKASPSEMPEAVPPDDLKDD